MPKAELLAELNALKTACLAQKKYKNHDSLQSRLKKIVEKISVDSDRTVAETCASLVAEINKLIEQLKTSNEAMIQTFDFKKESWRLIENGDLDNLKELVGIGNYFGAYIPYPSTKLTRWDVASTLDDVLQKYQLSHSLITEKNKSCLDYLCNLLNQPKLEIPRQTSSFSFSPQMMGFDEELLGLNMPGFSFSNFGPREKTIEEILAADDFAALTIYLMNHSAEDRHHAFRLACSKEGAMECLSFLTYQTNPSKKESDSYIDLLDVDKQTLQCAMHKAVASGSAVIIDLLLRREINKSTDILRQLLVKDKNGETPIDYLARLDTNSRRGAMNTITNLIPALQMNPQLALTDDQHALVKSNIENYKKEFSSSFAATSSRSFHAPKKTSFDVLREKINLIIGDDTQQFPKNLIQDVLFSDQNKMSENANRVLRRLCTSNEPKALLLVKVLFEYADELKLNPLELNKDQQSALEIAKSKNAEVYAYLNMQCSAAPAWK